MLLKSLFRNDRAVLAILIDPEKTHTEQFMVLLSLLPENAPDLILIGGSACISEDVNELIQQIKRRVNVPIILFPGGPEQLSSEADGMLLCSLISGRNPEFLIGKHVRHALDIAALEIPVWPVGYILLDGQNVSSTSLFTKTPPLSTGDHKTILQTAVAGQLLGMKAIYLEAGSGAKKSIEPEIISLVSSAIQCPLIVGGGIQSRSDVRQVVASGASMVVIGTALEKHPEELPAFVETVQHCLV